MHRFLATLAATAAFAVSTAVSAQNALPSFAPIIKSVSPAVVNIAVRGTVAAPRNPFFDDPGLMADADNRPPALYKRIMKPGVPDLFYMGLAQPLPTLVNFAEQQSKLVGAYLAGQYLPPEESEMHRIIRADEEYYTGQYYAARRHTIQLDFDHYCRALKKELAKGAKRAAAKGNPLPVAGRTKAAA